MVFRHNKILKWLLHEHNQLQEEIEYRNGQGESIDEGYLSSRISDIESEASQEKHALGMYGMLQGLDPRIVLFDGLLLFGVLQLMTIVSFLFMVQALEQMYVKLVFILRCC